jgi:hypothetical protein
MEKCAFAKNFKGNKNGNCSLFEFQKSHAQQTIVWVKVHFGFERKCTGI